MAGSINIVMVSIWQIRKIIDTMAVLLRVGFFETIGTTTVAIW